MHSSGARTGCLSRSASSSSLCSTYGPQCHSDLSPPPRAAGAQTPSTRRPRVAAHSPPWPPGTKGLPTRPRLQGHHFGQQRELLIPVETAMLSVLLHQEADPLRVVQPPPTRQRQEARLKPFRSSQRHVLVAADHLSVQRPLIYLWRTAWRAFRAARRLSSAADRAISSSSHLQEQCFLHNLQALSVRFRLQHPVHLEISLKTLASSL